MSVDSHAEPASSGPEHEWMALARACMENGDDLVSDAELLLANARAPRALSLAVLALEEYGKGIQALAVLGSGGNAAEMREYKELADAHRPKIRTSIAWRAIFDSTTEIDNGYPERLEQEVRGLGRRKLNGFYVDRGEDSPRLPRDIAQEEAAEAVSLARPLGDHLRRFLAPIAGDEVVSQFWKLGAQVREALESKFASAEPSLGALFTASRSVMTSLGIELPRELQVGRVIDGQPVFLGVDLAWADGSAAANETGVVLLAADGAVLAAGWARGIEETLAWMDRNVKEDHVVAFVDAPLVVRNTSGQRQCEREVGQRYGRWKVSANSTNTASRLDAGVTLMAALRDSGWIYNDGLAGPPTAPGRWVSECYPYTTLVGAPELGYDLERPRYKRSPRGLRAAEWKPKRAAACDELIRHMVALATADPPLDLTSHPATRTLIDVPSPLEHKAYKHREDLIDAALCAWTASLWFHHGLQRCQVLGDRSEQPEAATIIAPARPEQRR